MDCFVHNTPLRLEVREVLRGVGDLERWTNRITQGVALPRDLVGMRQVLGQAPLLLQILAGERAPVGWNGHAPAGEARAAAQILPDLPLCTEVLAAADRRIGR